MAEEKMEEGLKNENFRVQEWEELPQGKKNDEKTRGPELQKMPEEGEENEKVSRKTQMLLRLRRSIGLCWKWIKAKKLETEPSGTATSPYTAMNTALLLKKWK